tara:strand:- start:709 stop:912 length:204 start_codon:yes stop_codon:yes gene_type:complete
MSRCKACDTIMNEYELKRIDRITGDFSELCSNCLSASTEALREDSSMHTILEGLDNPLELLADLEIN